MLARTFSWMWAVIEGKSGRCFDGIVGKLACSSWKRNVLSAPMLNTFPPLCPDFSSCSAATSMIELSMMTSCRPRCTSSRNCARDIDGSAAMAASRVVSGSSGPRPGRMDASCVIVVVASRRGRDSESSRRP